MAAVDVGLQIRFLITIREDGQPKLDQLLPDLLPIHDRTVYVFKFKCGLELEIKQDFSAGM